MVTPTVTLDLLYAAEWIDLAYWSARGSVMGSLQQREFGRAVAILDTNDPSEHLNRVFFANTLDPNMLGEVLDWYRIWGRSPRFDVLPQPDRSSMAVQAALARRGFYHAYFKSVMIAPEIPRIPKQPPSNITIQPIPHSLAGLAAGIYARSFGFTAYTEPIRYHSFTYMFNMPNTRVYGAWIGDILAGVAMLFLAEGAGYMATAATDPQFRGRGIQTALLYHRIQEAAALGATWIAAHTEAYSVSQRNMQRVGLTIGCTKAIWMQLP